MLKCTLPLKQSVVKLQHETNASNFKTGNFDGLPKSGKCPPMVQLIPAKDATVLFGV